MTTMHRADFFHPDLLLHRIFTSFSTTKLPPDAAQAIFSNTAALSRAHLALREPPGAEAARSQLPRLRLGAHTSLKGSDRHAGHGLVESLWPWRTSLGLQARAGLSPAAAKAGGKHTSRMDSDQERFNNPAESNTEGTEQLLETQVFFPMTFALR